MFVEGAARALHNARPTWVGGSRWTSVCGIVLPLLLGLCASAQAAAGPIVDLLGGPYANCPGSGCAKGDYRWSSDAIVSAGSWVLSASDGHFTSADVGKRGVALDWYAGNGTSGCWSGWACFKGVSCQFTISAVNSPTSITVSPVAGCGSSGIGFNSSGNSYWSVYSDDSKPLANAVNAASGGMLTVASNYKGGIYTGVTIPAGTTVSCANGGTFFEPKLNTATTILMQPGNNVTIEGCTFDGTEPTSGPWYDPRREYNVIIAIWGSNGVTIQNNLFKNIWATYVVGSSGGSNATITHNTFQNNAYYAIQLNRIGGTNPGTYVTYNSVIDCFMGAEDASGVSGSPNQNQYWEYNTVYVGPAGGSGYYRTQKALGLWNAGSVWISGGTSASGGTPNAEEYLGVYVEHNYICGKDSHLNPAPSGTPYTKSYGETVINNTCENGCNQTPITGACPPSTSSSGSIALKQDAAVEGSAVPSVSVAFPSPNTAGDFIIAFVRMSTATQTVSVTDSLGNAYVDAVHQVQTSDGHQIHLFYAKNVRAGSNTIKAVFSAANNHPWLAIYEFSGLSTTSPLNLTTSAQGYGTSANSGTITGTGGEQLLFAAAGFTGGWSGTAATGSGYTQGLADTNSSRASTEYAITSSFSGSHSGAFNPLSTSTNWSCAMATFH
jgi:hypothetical protein